MPVLKRRSRVLSFRLSDEEYAAMMEGCISSGSRSLSEYARSAACGALDSRGFSRQDVKSERAIRRLKNRVEELDRLVQQLTLEMDSHRAFEGVPLRGNRIDRDVPTSTASKSPRPRLSDS